MKKKILAFGASNSKNSINKKLATFATTLIEDADIQILDLNDFVMPIYSIDLENESGVPELATTFKKYIQDADGIIISFAEHNGAYSAAFKNIFDWISRLEGSVWDNKPMLLMATSPGARGGKSVLDLATASFRFMNENTIHSFSLPAFHNHFSDEAGITDEALLKGLKKEVASFSKSMREVFVN